MNGGGLGVGVVNVKLSGAACPRPLERVDRNILDLSKCFQRSNIGRTTQDG